MTTEATLQGRAELPLGQQAAQQHRPTMITLREIVAQVRDFIDANRPRFTSRPAGWADHWEKSLAFHATRGNLALVWNGRAGSPLPAEAGAHGVTRPTLIGCAIAWRTYEGSIWQAEHSRRSVFDWTGNQPHGDAVYLALVCTAPVGQESSRAAIRTLARYYLDRWPEWAGLKQFCHRRGQLRREDGLLNRLAGLALRQQRPTEVGRTCPFATDRQSPST